MTKNRMEAFSDGVIAIIITIMVLELKVPRGADLSTLAAHSRLPELRPQFRLYRYLLEQSSSPAACGEHVDGRILWANLHLLFWLSLTPFVTAWMGENYFARGPVALYGTVLLFAAIAYFILVRALLVRHGPNSILATALGGDFKGKISMVIYLVAIPLAFVNSWLACALYVLVSIMWLIPDRRIERTLTT